MPNNVYNRLKIKGDPAEIANLIAFMKTSESNFDFNAVKPIPKSLNVESGMENTCIERYLRAANPDNAHISIPNISKISDADMNAIIGIFNRTYPLLTLDPRVISDNAPSAVRLDDPDLIVRGQIYANNILQFGYPSWYSWACANWGTKWNAYDITVDASGEIYFTTAWSAPHPVMAALAEKFPTLGFAHDWADECTGSNAGRAAYLDGSCSARVCYADQSREAYETYFDIGDITAEDAGYKYDPVLGTYIYANDEYDIVQHLAYPKIRAHAVMIRRGGKRISIARRVDIDNERSLIKWMAR